MPFAACALLVIALGIVAYRSGLKRGTDAAQQKTATPSLSTGSIEEQISDFGHERAQLLARLADDDRALKDFKREVAEQTVEIARLKELHDAAAASRQNATQSGANRTSRNRHVLTPISLRRKRNLQQLQAKVDALSQQRDAAARHAAVLEAKVDELTQDVHANESRHWTNNRQRLRNNRICWTTTATSVN